MPVYFGLPLNIDEIIRLLNISESNIKEFNEHYYRDIKYHTSYFHDNYVKYLIVSSHLKNKTKIDIFTTDKGQFILGYRIDEIRDVWNEFMNVDEFIEVLNKLKINFEEDINTLNIDLFHVELERMENTSVYVNYPKPFIIDWSTM